MDNEHSERLDTIEKVAAWAEKVHGYVDFANWSKSKGPEYWWQQREQMRIANRMRPSWISRYSNLTPPPASFFVYISELNPLKIAYTPTPEDGRRDRQVVTTVGRFFTKHYRDHFSDAEIRNIADRHREEHSNPTVFFAFSADDIEYVYENGPESCMAGKNWRHEHPVRVYDGPDTAVAFLKKTNGRIAARTTIHLGKKPLAYTRIYGDEGLLRSRLIRLGFENGDLCDARLRLAEVRSDNYICPFIDGVGEAEATNDFLILGDGELCCQQTDGLCGYGNPDEENTVECNGCGDFFNEEDMYTTYEEDYRCPGCIQDNYSEAIVSSGGRREFVNDSSMIQIGGTCYLNDHELLEKLDFRFSEANDKWLEEDAAAFIDSEDDYYPIEECCLVNHEWEIKENCFQDHEGRWFLKAPSQLPTRQRRSRRQSMAP